MTLKYIREHYHLPSVKRGAKVRYKIWAGCGSGIIMGGDHHVIVKPDNDPNARLRFHPDDLLYLEVKK